MLTFESLGLSPELNRALEAMKFTAPSPIQAEAIPHLLENKDIIGQAQTGTGKTAAFAIPIIERLDVSRREAQALVLCPTRELALQVTEEFRKLVKFKKGISIVSVYGGQPMDRQLLALQSRPQVIVATPGRMLDHLWRDTINVSAVQTVVLDEADEMLDMGFREDIESILCHIPQERQMVLFSATMPKAIIELTRQYQTNPEHIRIETPQEDVSRIQQEYIQVNSRTKFEALTKLIDAHQFKLGLVFCNTKRQVDQLAESLKSAGYRAEGLHGGMSQVKRDKVMGRFRRGAFHFLVATDVAARGIDVQNVQAVFNYDLPENTENYMHRIGRTGRAGKTGQAFTFVSATQYQDLMNANGDPSQVPTRPQSSNGSRRRRSFGGNQANQNSTGRPDRHRSKNGAKGRSHKPGNPKNNPNNPQEKRGKAYAV